MAVAKSATVKPALAKPPRVRARPAASGNHGKLLLHAHRMDSQAKIEMIRDRVPAGRVGQLAARMNTSKEFLIMSLGLSRATISRKERNQAKLSRDESERVLGVEHLIGMVQTMVEQSGNPEGFDAPRWLSGWLANPLPALGGKTPASYMDTFEGQRLVADLLAMSQSGAYA